MNRETKFRGKSANDESGGFIYGSLLRGFFYNRITGKEIVYIASPDIFPDYDSFEDMESLVVEVHPESVGEYTGLKDKNGKEIYLSDYVRGVHRNWEWGNVVEVTFLNGCFMFGNYNAHEFFNKYTEIEVVGNVFQNPGLLEGEK